VQRQRRASRRRSLNADIEILQPISGHGVAINESEGGLRIAVDCALIVNETCLLRLCVPFGPARIERGRVAWLREVRDGFIVGLELESLH